MKNQNYLSELETIIGAIKINTKCCTIGDKTYYFEDINKVNLDNLDSNMDNILQIPISLGGLDTYLYQQFHCRENGNQQIFMNKNDFENRNFVELLSNANTGIGTWEPGWEIFDIEKNGRIIVKKNELKLWILRSQFIPSDANNITIGNKGFLAMVKEFRELLPGFYMANGNVSLEEGIPIVRIYWNVILKGAIPLVNILTTELNKYGVPFQFKILNNINYFFRADSGVLYMSKKYLENSIPSLSRIYNHVKSFLKPETPLFAKRLSPGISLAEDPENGESFGQNRSRIFAESIFQIYKKNLSEKEEKIKEVKGYFRSKSIDINRPYLKNIESIDIYEKILNGVFN